MDVCFKRGKRIIMSIEKLYHQILPREGFLFNEELSKPEEGQFCYNAAPSKGEGCFWYYVFKNMFVIQKQDFFFYDNFYLESPCTDFLALQYYESVSGEEFCPYCKLASNTFRLFIGEESKIFQAAYYKNIPIRSVSISIMPEFYEDYLKRRFDGKVLDLKEAFRYVMKNGECASLIVILKEIRKYDGHGIAAHFFYQGKVLEALSVIFDATIRKRNNSEKRYITKEDEKRLRAVAEYLNQNFAQQNSLHELSRIACMGTTKLKTMFSVCFGCTISEYIMRQKIKRAMYLLTETDLHIAEIAERVGYERADSFSKQFKKSTGVLPRMYRKDMLDS